MNTTANFLHVCGTFKAGGITSFVKSILELNPISAARHDLFVLFEKEKIEIPGTNVYYLGKWFGNPFKNSSKIWKIAKNYNSIMLHKAHPAVVFPLLFIKKRVFIFQHGMTVSRGTTIKRWLKKIWYSIIPILLNAKVICSTEFAYQKSRKNGIRISRRRVEIIPFGIKMKRRIKQVHNRREGEKEILMGSAGVLGKIKRFNVLIKSLINYKGKLKINLKIAGDGPEKESLLKLAARVTNKNVTIEFLGHIEDMTAFYDSLDLFIFPGHNESFGLVVLEALARKVPVVVFPDLGGTLSLVKDNVNGFILKPGIPGLEEFWDRLNQDPDTIKKVARNLSEPDLADYDIASTRLKLENLVLNGG